METIELAKQLDDRAVGWVSESEQGAWDSRASAMLKWPLFQQTLWSRLLHEIFPHLTGRFVAVRRRSSGEILGGMAVYRAESWLLGSKYVSVPYASILQPIMTSTADMVALMRFVSKTAAEEGIPKIEMRMIGCGLEKLPEGWQARTEFKHHYLDLVRGEEELLRGFSRTVRRQLKNSMNEGVRARLVVQAEEWRKFHEIYSRTRHRLGLPAMPWRFFEAIQRIFPPEDVILVFAERDGVVLGAVLGLCFNGTCLVDWMGDSEPGRRMDANQPLYWTAIREAIQRGCRMFSFGRTACSNEGLIAFKQKWGTAEEDLQTFSWQAGGQQRSGGRSLNAGGRKSIPQRVIQATPKIGYSLISEFCYRHLA